MSSRKASVWNHKKHDTNVKTRFAGLFVATAALTTSLSFLKTEHSATDPRFSVTVNTTELQCPQLWWCIAQGLPIALDSFEHDLLFGSCTKLTAVQRTTSCISLSKQNPEVYRSLLPLDSSILWVTYFTPCLLETSRVRKAVRSQCFVQPHETNNLPCTWFALKVPSHYDVSQWIVSTGLPVCRLNHNPFVSFECRGCIAQSIAILTNTDTSSLRKRATCERSRPSCHGGRAPAGQPPEQHPCLPWDFSESMCVTQQSQNDIVLLLASRSENASGQSCSVETSTSITFLCNCRSLRVRREPAARKSSPELQTQLHAVQRQQKLWSGRPQIRHRAVFFTVVISRRMVSRKCKSSSNTWKGATQGVRGMIYCNEKIGPLCLY